MTNPIIIVGSSRSLGETRKAVDLVIDNSDIPIIDLKTLDISVYDYEHHNKNDDFLLLMERIVDHDLIVLATPVYWYTMSATMKIFLDRITDLLEIKKDLGRKLRGKKLFVIASLGTVLLPRGFEDAFQQTSEYLGMEYKGCSFIHNGNSDFDKDNEIEIEKARNILFKPHLNSN